MTIQRETDIIDAVATPSVGGLELIGVFDSGLGGLSVLTELRKAMPDADLTYVADRARSPYGLRSLEDVKAMSREIVGWLSGHRVSTVVLACNTASAAALEALRAENPELAFVGMEPAVKPAAESTRSGVIGVLATAATFQGQLFRSVVNRHARGVRVISRACPGWVDLVERGSTDGPIVENAVRREVEPLLEGEADLLVIGCTHFSFLIPVIRRIVGEKVTIVDPAPAVAAQTARVAPMQDGSGSLVLAASGDLDEFVSLADTIAGVKSDAPALPFPG